MKISTRVAFGAFEFDRQELTLWRAGTMVSLTPKASEALGLLLGEPGTLVPKERLRESLWPEGFVEDGNLTQTIYMLRRVLDPDGDGRAFIETVPRRGYRFVAPVAVSKPAASPAVRAIRARLALACGFVILLLGVTLAGAAQSRTRLYPGLSAESAREYALGRYYWDKRTLDATRISIAYFADVARLSPRSALGYAGLADAYAMIANHMMLPGNMKPYYAQAEAYARQALAQDPHSGEALTTLAFIAWSRDHDSVRAERQLRAAVALRPLHAPAHEFLGAIAINKGNVAEANDELARAAELDPTSSPILGWLGVTNYYAHRFEDARRALRQAIDLDVRNTDAMYHLVLVDERLGNVEEARAVLGRLYRAKANSMRVDKTASAAHDALAALIALRAGDRSLAERTVPDMRPGRGAAANALLYAALCDRLGRRDDALAWVKIGVTDEEGGDMRKLLSADPQLADLSGDQRFRRIVS